jgi:hypothetical protein
VAEQRDTPVSTTFCDMEEKMELKDFVKSVIVELVTGLSEANDAVRPSGAIVNPANVFPLKEEFGHLYGHIGETKMRRAVHKIDFDVAVTAAEGKETKGGIGIAVATLGLGASGKSDSTQSTTSRIQFSVPIAYAESK